MQLRLIRMTIQTQKTGHIESFWRLVHNASTTRRLANVYCSYVTYYTCNRLIVIYKMLSSQNYMNIILKNK